MYVNTRMIEVLPPSQIKQTIVENRQYFDAGFIGTDVTVFYYISSGYTNPYEATHSWAFQEHCMKLAETDCQKAF
jgi:hypothetical protein